ncbi:major facilitator superfamily domain-containing protein [Multifurca ochricompacta]|uniref:Major facilitator superfamily domain-containing protein n=1 Tax=Multifurca ochricompacta TaxID=376703 RepID=A0AAD4QLU7_9AGAM|nr:major facilitator superfamily domain-containing protein [Multifurca ochricompacta]
MPPRRSECLANEETPLLRGENVQRKPTPLPVTQILVLLLLQLAEPITSLSINPYINQLVSELPVIGGDERKVGYYAGILVSLYFAAEAVTILQWSRLSDYIGRKPVLLCGLFGTIISSILFGLSRSFPALVMSRCLHGMLNGNIGVMKSMMAELTDETNVARGFSLIPVVWAVGGTIGPFIGGVLSRPQDRWPGLFSHPFWAEYPYFLPCLGTAFYAFMSFVLAAVFLKETVECSPLAMHKTLDINSDIPRAGAGEILDESVKDLEKPLPLRSLLTRPVVISIANYGMIGLLEVTAGALIPLVWSTSAEFGGLGMSPASIGLWMAGYGFLNGIFQFVAFPHVVGRFGPRGVFISSILVFIPIYILFPFENLALRHASGDANVIAPLLIALQLCFVSFSDMGFSSVFMYITSATPNKRCLGATNGLAQTMVSIQRTVGPAAAASLFAFSLNNNVLNGNFTYVVLLVVVGGVLCVAVQLPKKTWSRCEK